MLLNLQLFGVTFLLGSLFCHERCHRLLDTIAASQGSRKTGNYGAQVANVTQKLLVLFSTQRIVYRKFSLQLWYRSAKVRSQVHFDNAFQYAQTDTKKKAVSVLLGFFLFFHGNSKNLREKAILKGNVIFYHNLLFCYF